MNRHYLTSMQFFIICVLSTFTSVGLFSFAITCAFIELFAAIAMDSNRSPEDGE